MKDSEGKRTYWPGAGSSEYFRLQAQLQDAIPSRSSSTRPPEIKRSRVGYWQPKYPDVARTTLGETEEDVKKRYPDETDQNIPIVPPATLNEQDVKKAIDDSWKMVPYENKYRKPDGWASLFYKKNDEYQRMRYNLLKAAKQARQSENTYMRDKDYYTGKPRDIDLENYNREWRNYEDFIDRMKLPYVPQKPSKLPALDGPETPETPETWTDWFLSKQKGKGITASYKKPRGWLQE